MARPLHLTPVLLAFGLAAFGLAGLSIADMFVPRPYDGVVLSSDQPGRLIVREVIAGSGADRAGIEPGDQIIGIGREMVHDGQDAAEELNNFRSGDEVPYFIRKRSGGAGETAVRLGVRRLGDGTYFYSCTLGFAFFFIGLFVLVRQPALRASQVFFLLCGLFLLFLVCRMRPASYSGIDSLLLAIGTVAFLLLPPAFLHFYLIFPRPAWLQAMADRPRWRLVTRFWKSGWTLFYILPLEAWLRYLRGDAEAAWEEISGYLERLEGFDLVAFRIATMTGRKVVAEEMEHNLHVRRDRMI